MEEVHRLHKEVPFGWMLLLQQALARRARRKAAKRAAESLDRHRAKRDAERDENPYRLDSRFIRGW